MYVRLGLKSDEDAVVELGRQNCALSTPHLEFSEEVTRATYRDYLATAASTIFVAEHDGEVVAFLLATISTYRQSAGIFTTQEVLFVKPEYRGSRAAVLLMKELVRWSKMLGAKEITGGNDNGFQSDRTARFLEHFGFKQVGNFMRRDLLDG